MEPIVNALLGPCREFFGYIMSLEKNINSLETEWGELSGRREDLKEKVQEAMRWGREPSISVKEWLNHAENLESEMNQIHAEWGKRVRCLGDCSVNVWSSYDLSKRAEEKWTEAVELKGKYPLGELTNQMVPARRMRMPSAELIGRETVLEQLRHLVGDEKVGIIGIHGMGGVGKTALLERLHNEFLTEFAVIWIEATRGLNVEEIQRALGDQLGLLPWEGKSLQTKERATILLSALSKMKFLLILDGLWDHLDLKTVGIPTPDHKSMSKIILTTRIETVCDWMDATKIKLECLAKEEAQELLKHKAGEEIIRANSQIQQYAEQLADDCGGLPLALIAVGRALARKRRAQEWQRMLLTLNRKPWRVPGMKEEVLERLKLSYDRLQDNELRSCLSCASLLKRDVHIYQDWIVNYCIGEGVIDDFDDPVVAHNMGHHHLGILRASSLLENSNNEDHVKMHPMIRAMVLWVECRYGEQENSLLVRAGEGLREAPDVERWRGAEQISLAHNEITALPDQSPDCPELLTLYLQRNAGLAKIPDGFFRFMPSLKVLDLSYTAIRELPLGVGELAGLQYIDLTRTKITSLPDNLGGLTKLRFLILQFTYRLQTIPKGLIASLAELRVLDVYGSYMKWDEDAGLCGEGAGVEELEGLKKLRNLAITVRTAASLGRLSGSRQLAPVTKSVYLRNYGLATIRLPSSTFGRNMESLNWLRVANCSKLEEVVIGSEDWPALPCFEGLVLQWLPRAKIIWRGRSLQSLKELKIWNCGKIEELMDCDDEEAKGEGECEPFVAFPNLLRIELYDLPEFRSLSIGGRTLGFPSLRTLSVTKCPKLKRLALGDHNLRMIQGEKEWWDALEWEDDSIRSSLQSAFEELQ